MSRYQESAPHYTHPLDSKARRKLLDERRMRFRRAIERYDEQRQLQYELDDYPDMIVASSLQMTPGVARQSVRQAR